MNFTSTTANARCATARATDTRIHFSTSTSNHPRPISSHSANSRSRKLAKTRAQSSTNVDWEAIQDIYSASRQKFVGLAYTILRNRDDAEDAVQDAFLSAYRYLSSFEGRSAFTTWFTRIVVNAALMIRRKRKSSGTDAIPESHDAEDISWTERIPDPRHDPEMVCADGEIIQLIDRQLGKMNPILRRAFTLTYYDEMSSVEAGMVLGVTPGTLKSRVSRARQQLQHRAQRFINTPSRNGGHSPFCPCKDNFRTPPAKPARRLSREFALS